MNPNYDNMFAQSPYSNNSWSNSSMDPQQQGSSSSSNSGILPPTNYLGQNFNFSDYSTLLGSGAATNAYINDQQNQTFFPPPESSSGSGHSPVLSHNPAAASLLPYPQSVYNAKPQDLQSGYRPNAAGSADAASSGDFLKRKNWPSLLIDEYSEFLHVLSPTGHFLFTTDSIAALTGYESHELVGHSITEFIHADDIKTLVQAFNDSIITGDEMIVYIRFKQQQGGRYFIFEIRGRPRYGEESRTGTVPPFTRVTSKINNATVNTFAVDPSALAHLISNATPHLVSGPAGFQRNQPNANDCKCFLATARPYPGKHVAMQDEFLEYKIENERLRNQLKQQYDEIEAEGGSEGLNLPRDSILNQPPQNYASPPDTSSASALYSNAYSFPYNSNSAAYQQPQLNMNYSAQLAGDAQDPNYRVHKRQSISMDKSKQDEANKKTRKASRRGEPGQYVCHDCGTLDSPEWRKGPDGPKSLCNACGLRYAKRSKVPGQEKPVKAAKLKGVQHD